MRSAKFYILIGVGLLVAALVIFKRVSGTDHYALQQIQSRLDEVVAGQEEDLDAFINQLEIYSNPFDITSEKRFLKCVYIDKRLIYWSSAEKLPGFPESSPDSIDFVTSERGIYLVARERIRQGSGTVEVLSYYQIYKSPAILNEYLKNQVDPSLFGGVSVDFSSNANSSLSLTNGRTLPVQIREVHQTLLDSALILLVLLGLTIFYVGSIRKATNLPLRISCLILIRVLLYFVTPYLADLDVFNPAYYTANVLNRTLGDLILNGSLVLAILLEIRFSFLPKANTLICAGLSIVLLLGGWAFYEGIWDILENSQISLNVMEDISLSWIRFFAAVAILIYSGIYFLIFRYTFLGFFGSAVSPSVKLILTGGTTVLFYFLAPIDAVIIFPIISGFFWGAYLLKVGLNRSTLNYKSLVFSILIFCCLSCIYSTTIYKYFEKDQLVMKEKFANWVLIKSDILGELYLRQAIDEVQKDAYIRSRFFNPALSKTFIRDKIKTEYLSSYFKRYEVTTYLFDQEGVPMGEYDSLSSFKSRYFTETFKTNYENIFLVEGEDGKKSYLCLIPITSFQTALGTIVLELTPKKYIPYEVFPRLLIESQNTLGTDQEFDYGVYADGRLLYKQGKFEFENRLSYEDLTNPDLFVKGLEREEMHLWGVKTNQNQTIVIVSETFPYTGLIANFSLLLIFLFFSLAVTLIVNRYLIARSETTLSYKIQIYLGFSFVIPMLLVSLAILSELDESNKKNMDSSFQNKARGISNAIAQLTEAFVKGELNRDEFITRINTTSELIQSDINIYNENGILIGTTEPELFSLELIGRQADAGAYNALKYGDKESVILKKYIGLLGFKVTYNAIYSGKTGEFIGIFSLPYFESMTLVNDQQRQVFASLISIFTVILLASILGGNFIITRLTSPLKQITKRLQTTNFEGENQPIVYQSDDEIGALVKEYNSMISKLEASKEALAESQKASAWQEIARQVAHEIKNPLTPMRLKIQQMSRVKAKDDPDIAVLNSLLAQIDTLSSIADSFSEFAKMPVPKHERLDLTRLIRETCGLYGSEKVDMHHELGEKPLWIFADPRMLGGVLNNVVLNAIQSTETKPQIHISLKKKGQSALISIHDNGSGIPDDIHDEVFKPYFSTKSTGSGIGLAVAKKGIENAGGTIWFETEVGVGTTFFISLPLAAVSDHTK